MLAGSWNIITLILSQVPAFVCGGLFIFFLILAVTVYWIWEGRFPTHWRWKRGTLLFLAVLIVLELIGIGFASLL